MVAFDFPRTTRPAEPRQLARTSDGDTPVIDQPVRMVSVDTPEKQHYAGLPPTAQAKLHRCRQRLQDGTYAALPDGLREYLVGRLTPGCGRTPHRGRPGRQRRLRGTAGPAAHQARRQPPAGRGHPHRGVHRPLRAAAGLPGALVCWPTR
jgi:hypothetical protein